MELLERIGGVVQLAGVICLQYAYARTTRIPFWHISVPLRVGFPCSVPLRVGFLKPKSVPKRIWTNHTFSGTHLELKTLPLVPLCSKTLFSLPSLALKSAKNATRRCTLAISPTCQSAIIGISPLITATVTDKYLRPVIALNVIDSKAREIMHFQGSVCLSVCLFDCALTIEPFGQRP